MRKYYSPKGPLRAPSTIRFPNGIEWELLSAFVQGSASRLDNTVLELAQECIAKKSVKGYLALSEILDSRAQRYAGTESSDCVYLERQLMSLLKKYPFGESDLSSTPRQTAIGKWQEAEEMCFETNFRLRGMSLRTLPEWVPVAQRKIAELLGPLKPKVIMKIITSGGHGPGSTLSSRGNRVTEYFKYSDLPYTVTESARVYAYAAISANPRWMSILEDSGRRSELPPIQAPLYQKELMLLDDCVETVVSDKITFVPKDARTERPIAVGASLNMYLQLGVKTFLQERLKGIGVDLSDQEENTRKAYKGSRYSHVGSVSNPNQFSTIDLSSASDTISFELVKLLLPTEWFAFLCDLRHQSGSLDGSSLYYEKFSAMGNGFTFPLETLIFWAIVTSTIELEGGSTDPAHVSVYGDDIIVRAKYFESVHCSLSWAGFSLNTQKSFHTGPFKESCGADYFRGIDVRPFYLKREVRTYEDIYFICNSIANKAINHKCAGLVALYQALLALIPNKDRIYIPMDSDSLLGFRVPLQYVSNLGLRPWLSTSERFSLLKRKLMKVEHSSLQCMYAPVFSYVAKSFSGKASIRLMLALQNDAPPPHFYISVEGKQHYEAARHGTVTRRNAVTGSFTVRPILNWNGTCKHNLLICHPIWSEKPN